MKSGSLLNVRWRAFPGLKKWWHSLPHRGKIRPSPQPADELRVNG